MIPWPDSCYIQTLNDSASLSLQDGSEYLSALHHHYNSWSCFGSSFSNSCCIRSLNGLASLSLHWVPQGHQPQAFKKSTPRSSPQLSRWKSSALACSHSHLLSLLMNPFIAVYLQMRATCTRNLPCSKLPVYWLTSLRHPLWTSVLSLWLRPPHQPHHCHYSPCLSVGEVWPCAQHKLGRHRQNMYVIYFVVHGLFTPHGTQLLMQHWGKF